MPVSVPTIQVTRSLFLVHTRQSHCCHGDSVTRVNRLPVFQDHFGEHLGVCLVRCLAVATCAQRQHCKSVLERMVKSNNGILLDTIFNTFNQVITMKRSWVLANGLDTQHYVCHSTCCDVLQPLFVDVFSDFFNSKFGDHVNGETIESEGVEGRSTDVSKCRGVFVC